MKPLWTICATAAMVVVLASTASAQQVDYRDLIAVRVGEQNLMHHDSVPFTGSSHEYFSNGQLGFEWAYRDGLRHGISKSWSPDGVLVHEVLWLNGERTSTETRWEPNGELSYKSTCDVTTKRCSVFVDCHDNPGNDACEVATDSQVKVWAVYEDGRKVGRWQVGEHPPVFVDHHYLGYNDLMHRLVWLNSSGDTNRCIKSL